MIIALAGMGRLGRTLAALLPEAGHEVRPWSRGRARPDCEVLLLTVSDGAIAEVAAAWPAGPIVLHTSGATDWRVLRPHRPAGSLHPLQSFPGPEIAVPPMRGLPAALAGDPPAVAAAEAIARSLGWSPFEVPGDRRLYHAAAVLAGNFATVLLDRAAELLSAAGVDPAAAPGVLAPLALASIRQAGETGDPAAALTGPFARADRSVIAAHREAIEARVPGIAALYGELGRRAAELAERGGHISAEEREALIRLLD